MDDLKAFVYVVRCEGFTGAAAALEVPKSTISRRLARLEERLGVQLLHRTTRRVGLTESGERYFTRVEPLVDALETADGELRDLQARPLGRLRVTAPATFGSNLGAAVAAFALAYPGVDLRIDLTDRIVDLVEQDYDVAIRAGALLDSTLMARRLGVAGLVVVGSPSYLAARGNPARVDDLAAHDGLVHEETAWRDRWTFADGAAVRVRRRFASNDWGVLRDAALRGLGLVRIPEQLVHQDVIDGHLAEVLPLQRMEPGPIWAVWRPAPSVPPKVRVFVDHLVRGFAQGDSVDGRSHG